MTLIARILRWTATPVGQRLLFAATSILAIAVACNPELLPLLPVVDAMGLDVLVLLLGSQILTLLPWLRAHAVRHAPLARHLVSGFIAGAVGGYLRQLLFGSNSLTAYARRSRST